MQAQQNEYLSKHQQNEVSCKLLKDTNIQLRKVVDILVPKIGQNALKVHNLEEIHITISHSYGT